MPNTEVYKRYIDLCIENNSKPIRYTDAFSINGTPTDGKIDFREAPVEVFHAKSAKINKVTTTGKGKVKLIAGAGSVIENVLISNQGTDLFLFFGPECDIKNLVIQAFDHNYLCIGCGTTADGLNILLQGNDCGVFIGHDCMFSTNVFMRTSDSHSIISYSDGKRINNDSSVHIGDHVWIGRQTSIAKGAYISDDSVIGASSLVTSKIPSHTIAAGSPAKPIKENTTWDRARVNSASCISTTLNWRPKQNKVNSFLINDTPFLAASSDECSQERSRWTSLKQLRWLDFFSQT